MSTKRIPFVNNEGHTMYLSSSMTIAELTKIGVTMIRLVPEGTPLKDGEWRDTAVVPTPKTKKRSKKR